MKGAQVKAEQLSSDTVHPSQESRITSDFGTKQSNTDDWLRVANGDKTGPSLLEDAFGREKVRYLRNYVSQQHTDNSPDPQIRP